MTWFWGAWVAGANILGTLCFGLGQVGLAALAQLACPSPRLDLSDEALAAFIDATKADAELWGRS